MLPLKGPAPGKANVLGDTLQPKTEQFSASFTPTNVKKNPPQKCGSR